VQLPERVYGYLSTYDASWYLQRYNKSRSLHMSSENMNAADIACNLMTTVSVVIHTVTITNLVTKLVVADVRSRFEKYRNGASSRPIGTSANTVTARGVGNPTPGISKKKRTRSCARKRN
jgi:hypothetical protein